MKTKFASNYDQKNKKKQKKFNLITKTHRKITQMFVKFKIFNLDFLLLLFINIIYRIIIYK